MLATAALHREESRGGHFRTDFPKPDDERFLKNIVLTHADGDVRHELRPVPGLGEAPVPKGAHVDAVLA